MQLGPLKNTPCFWAEHSGKHFDESGAPMKFIGCPMTDKFCHTAVARCHARPTGAAAAQSVF